MRELPLDRCPICLDNEAKKFDGLNSIRTIDCPNCGPYKISTEAFDDLPAIMNEKQREKKRGLISHELRRQVDVEVSIAWIEHVISNCALPDISNQFSNFLKFMRGNQLSVSETMDLSDHQIASISGCPKVEDARVIVDHLIEEGLLEIPWGRNKNIQQSYRLTRAGLEVRVGPDAGGDEIAFMAMQFGEPNVEEVYTKIFRTAVAEIGVELGLSLSLEKVTENQGAGLIDQQIRSKIQKAPFLLADLSHGNKGAYWESGYAEGSGVPVIYTFDKAAWKEVGSHFNTEHSVTVMWDLEDVPSTKLELKSKIRATIETKMK